MSSSSPLPSLPGVGVFSGENTGLLVKELRRVGFTVRALWSSSRKSAQRLKEELSVECATTCIRELVLRTDVDLVVIDSPPPTHVQIATNALGIGKHVVCTLPAGLHLRDARRMHKAASYYPQLMAAASNPLRFLAQIQSIRRLIQSGKAGRVLLVEARLKENMAGGEQWKFDARMGGGSLSLLAAYVTDIISHILQEQATRAQAFSARSPTLSSCDTFTAFHLQFPSGAAASATVALTDYFEFELIFTCVNGTIRCDSDMNVTTRPTELVNKFNQGRTESLIETDSEQGETDRAEETTDANETEVEIKRDDDDEDEPTDDEPTTPEEVSEQSSEDQPPPVMIDQSTQVLIEKRNVRTGTECEIIRSSSVPVLKLGIPALIECIKNAFVQGGPDPRSWDQATLDETPVANFSDILYIQGVLDAARRSDKSGEWENVDTIDELSIETLSFQAEMSRYAEMVDQLQI